MWRRLLLSLLACGLLLWGLLALNSNLLALAIPLIAYLGAALLNAPGELRLSGVRTLSADRVSQQTPVTMRLTVSNEGGHLEEVAIEDRLPPRLESVAGEPRALTSVPPGDRVTLEYTVRATRGLFDLSQVQVTVCEPLGLLRRQVTLAVPGRLLVMPTAPRLRQLSVRPRRTLAYAGPVPARQGGSGVDFFGVREYQPGDSLRWINWKAIARHPTGFFANEFEQERITDVGLILDARRRSDRRRAEGERLFEHAVSATAALAQMFLSQGNRVGLLVYGRFPDWTFPGYGKVQHERILRALAQAETGESMVFERLENLPTRFFPARSQLVIISPLCADDLPTLVRLRAHGYHVLVISPDPVSFEVGGLEPQPEVTLAARIARIERTILLRRLLEAGIQVLDWAVERPFDLAVHAALGRSPQWFRAVGVRP